jgi:hypothetical protein
MDRKTLLADPACCLSVAWKALEKLLGTTALGYEPEVIRIELLRRSIEPTESLMAKLLAAQTILQSWTWVSDHDVLFAFALACDGIPATSGMIHHPTVEQLAWSMRELTALTEKTPNEDEGFDPDTIDPAIAVVLHEDGWVLAPKELGFCQPILDRFTKNETDFTHEVRAAWSDLHDYTTDGLRQKIDGLKENALNIQLRHLAGCRLDLEERERQRAQQHVWLSASSR